MLRFLYYFVHMKKYLTCLGLTAFLLISASVVKSQDKGVEYIKIDVDGSQTIKKDEIPKLRKFSKVTQSFYISRKEGRGHLLMEVPNSQNINIKYEGNVSVTKQEVEGVDGLFIRFVSKYATYELLYQPEKAGFYEVLDKNLLVYLVNDINLSYVVK